jgi:hypothetical protein
MYPPVQPNRSSLLEWSVAILGGAASVFLASQVHLTLLDKERSRSGYEDARLKAATLANTVRQWEESYQKREIYLQKIEAQEARHASFLNGLLELSKTDPDARGLVFRHKVGSVPSSPEGVAAKATPASAAPVSAVPGRAPEVPAPKMKTAVVGR